MKDKVLTALQYENQKKMFWLLQAADFGTTLWGFEIRLIEGNPIISMMMALTDPVTGLLAAKIIFATALYIYSMSRKWNALGLVNDIFIFIVLWNFLMIAARYLRLV